MTISQYMEVIGHIYKKNWKIDQLYQLLEVILEGSFQCKTYEVWNDYIGESIQQWKAQTF